ncbi:TPA: hypothetical protein JLD81_004454 [Escherichia coli]|nr:hypothetical protein [Escherichia coli]
MKKLMIASAIAMAMTAGSAMAAVKAGSQGQVQFVGTIAAKTCDVVVSGGGAVNNQIQFGVLEAGNGKTKQKEFTVKFKEPTCISAGDTAKFTWLSPTLDGKGFKNQSGTATEAYVSLNAKNGGTNVPDRNDAITDVNNAVQFTATQPEAGFVYQATLHAGTVPGSFETAASYTVVYE